MTFRLPQEPTAVNFDPERRTFIRFYDTNEARASKRTRDAVGLLLSRNDERARHALRSVIEDPDFSGEDTLWARVEVLRLEVEGGQLDPAAISLKEIEKIVRKEGWSFGGLARERDALEARLLLARGRAGAAVKFLESKDANGALSFEGTLVLATALAIAGEDRKLDTWINEHFAELHRVGGVELLRD